MHVSTFVNNESVVPYTVAKLANGYNYSTLATNLCKEWPFLSLLSVQPNASVSFSHSNYYSPKWLYMRYFRVLRTSDDYTTDGNYMAFDEITLMVEECLLKSPHHFSHDSVSMYMYMYMYILYRHRHTNYMH